eukprot:10339044-Alexandrium_andersonii.AAC.1
MQGATPERAEHVALHLLGEASLFGEDDDASAPEPMTDVVTEEEQRIIEADARAAAKNAFPHIMVTPTAEYGD